MSLWHVARSYYRELLDLLMGLQCISYGVLQEINVVAVAAVWELFWLIYGLISPRHGARSPYGEFQDLLMGLRSLSYGVLWEINVVAAAAVWDLWVWSMGLNVFDMGLEVPMGNLKISLWNCGALAMGCYGKLMLLLWLRSRTYMADLWTYKSLTWA